MACEQSDLSGDAGDEEFCKQFDVSLQWLGAMVQPSVDATGGLENQSYLTTNGKASHSGRFEISENEYFGVGAFPLHPDATVDTTILLCLIMALFTQIHGPDVRNCLHARSEVL